MRSLGGAILPRVGGQGMKAGGNTARREGMGGVGERREDRERFSGPEGREKVRVKI